VLTLWLLAHGRRKTSFVTRSDRRTVTRIVELAKGLGLAAGDSIERLSDAFVREVVAVMRPTKRHRHGALWACLVEHRSNTEASVTALVMCPPATWSSC